MKLLGAISKKIKQKKCVFRRQGFTVIEVVLVIVLGAIVLPVLMKGIWTGTETVVQTVKSDIAHLLAYEQLEVIRNAGYWIDDISTASPKFPGNAYDLAEQWKVRLGVDSRGFAANTTGTVAVTFLKGSTLADFSGAEFDGNSPRIKMRIKVTVARQGATANIESYQMVYPTDARLLSILRRIKLALQQYNVANGFYPATGGLDVLVSTFLAEIPNDPYTKEEVKISHSEEEPDYTFTNSGGVRELFANSKPSLKLTW